MLAAAAPLLALLFAPQLLMKKPFFSGWANNMYFYIVFDFFFVLAVAPPLLLMEPFFSWG